MAKAPTSKQKINVDSLKWSPRINEFPGVSEDGIQRLKENVPYPIPKLYLDLMRIKDGGVLVDDEYPFSSPGRGGGDWQDCVGRIYSIDQMEYPCSNVVYVYKNKPACFEDIKGSHKLVAFADSGGGDYLCFDYRKNSKNPDPPIVRVEHDVDPDLALIPIAENFESFLLMLSPGEPMDWEIPEDPPRWKRILWILWMYLTERKPK